MDIGLYTFADVAAGHPELAGQRLRNLVEEMELADQVGLDVFAVGEHHRADYAVSSPAVAIAAGAARTTRIRLSSAVTVLSSDDPVRVFQQYATVDGLSNGRAEIMAGRGSFIESYPLFGFDLDDYDALFAEKLDLLMKLREHERITWQGALRPSITNLGIYPRPEQKNLPIWIAVGGTPQSVVRAASLDLPMALAIIGGDPRRFQPFFALYRDAHAKSGHDPKSIQLSLNMHGFVSDSDEKARDIYSAAHLEVMNRIGRERGWPPQGREHFEASCGPTGNLIVGGPDRVADRIIELHSIFGNTRILIQMAIGTVPHAEQMRAIELMGTKVAPKVRAAVGGVS
ncbi:MAG: LLM class flavin-dependent oxidoreductase [Rhizobiales bacterium]|nr:LLM class flavin-dependent oxidoreductase [Hyphomicrobiales bacterium]